MFYAWDGEGGEGGWQRGKMFVDEAERTRNGEETEIGRKIVENGGVGESPSLSS
jgi:hypothetical protein